MRSLQGAIDQIDLRCSFPNQALGHGSGRSPSSQDHHPLPFWIEADLFLDGGTKASAIGVISFLLNPLYLKRFIVFSLGTRFAGDRVTVVERGDVS